MIGLDTFWIVGGAVLAPVSLWWARKGWLELDRLNGAPRASGGEIIFGFMAVSGMALLFLGFLVPAALVSLRLFVIDPTIARIGREERGEG